MDTRTLFVKQVSAHAQTMHELLTSAGGVTLGAEMAERGLVTTRMLAGTTSLMELAEWTRLFEAYGSLLGKYRSLSHPWDDRIASVTSEIIEREEALVTSHEEDPERPFSAAVAAVELEALCVEIAALEEECDAYEPPPAVEPKVPAPDATPAAPVALDSIGAEPIPPAPPVPADAPLPGITNRLAESLERMQARFHSSEWVSREWSSAMATDIRRELSILEIFARSACRIIDGEAPPALDSVRCDLSPVSVVLDDFSAELCNGSGRDLSVAISAAHVDVHPNVVLSLTTILQSMVRDIFSRCDGQSLSVNINVTEAKGALRIVVTDDGDNFLSDAPLDHEDQLAHYPGLRAAMQLLSECNGVLWVEPAHNRDARFEFTMPAAMDPLPLIIWGQGADSFSARASQVCDTVPATSDKRGSDSHGEFVEVEGRRVPLVRLDALYTDAPGAGDTIAVLGCVEKRVAFYVPGTNVAANGRLANDDVALWKGASLKVADVHGQRVPVVEAGRILSSYHDVTGANSDQLSGGATEDDKELSNSQAAPTSGVTAPPDTNSETQTSAGHAVPTSAVNVLVVEQSESMRDELTGILERHQVKAAFADGVEEALSLMGNGELQLIISEFRMPTMAAKVLVDQLRQSGQSVPVLVTTSQTGKTADLLVEKLGVSGYISKPLSSDQVSDTLTSYLQGSVSG